MNQRRLMQWKKVSIILTYCRIRIKGEQLVTYGPLILTTPSKIIMRCSAALTVMLLFALGLELCLAAPVLTATVSLAPTTSRVSCESFCCHTRARLCKLMKKKCCLWTCNWDIAPYSEQVRIMLSSRIFHNRQNIFLVKINKNLEIKNLISKFSVLKRLVS